MRVLCTYLMNTESTDVSLLLSGLLVLSLLSPHNGQDFGDASRVPQASAGPGLRQLDITLWRVVSLARNRSPPTFPDRV